MQVEKRTAERPCPMSDKTPPQERWKPTPTQYTLNHWRCAFSTQLPLTLHQWRSVGQVFGAWGQHPKKPAPPPDFSNRWCMTRMVSELLNSWEGRCVLPLCAEQEGSTTLCHTWCTQLWVRNKFYIRMEANLFLSDTSSRWDMSLACSFGLDLLV